MKILFKQHRYHSNVFDWFRAFQELGHEPELLVYRSDETIVEGLPKAVYLKQSSLSKWIVKRSGHTRGDGVDKFSPYYFPSLKTLYAYLRQSKPRVIITRPIFTIYSYQIILISFILRFRLVFYSQIRICKEVSLIKRVFLEVLLWITQGVWISPCPGNPEKFKPISKRMHFFPFVKKDPLARRSEYFKDGVINLLIVAKIYPAKNIELAVRAFLRLKEKHSNIRITICAGSNIHESSHEKLKKLINSSKHKASIEMRIAVPFDEMKQVYLDNDILILPSNYDQAALVPIESMGHGLVTYASTGNGTSNYLTDGFDGFVFEKNNEEELVHKLNYLFEHPDQIPTMGKRALVTVKNNHDPAGVVTDLLGRLNLN